MLSAETEGGLKLGAGSEPTRWAELFCGCKALYGLVRNAEGSNRCKPSCYLCFSVTDYWQMSTCTGLSAVDHANTKYSAGYATTGAGCCTCGRHEVVFGNGVGDLQKGEKYDHSYLVVIFSLSFFLLDMEISTTFLLRS